MMKKFFKIFWTVLLLMSLNIGFVKADNPIVSSSSSTSVNQNDFYAFHPLNKFALNNDSVGIKILGYQYIKSPRPSANRNARYMIVKCQIDTKDLDQDEAKYAYVDSEFLKIYDNGIKASNIDNSLSDKRLKRAPFNNVTSTLSHMKMNKVYEFDVAAVVYPFDDIELRFSPDGENDYERIKIHQVKSSNGVTMDSQDPLANYEQEAN